jgi:hypothetical protein
MKRYLIPIACILPLALAACTPQQQSDATQCGLALYAAKVQNAAELIQVAQQVPPCRALAIDAMQAVVAEVMARRGIK